MKKILRDSEQAQKGITYRYDGYQGKKDLFFVAAVFHAGVIYPVNENILMPERNQYVMKLSWHRRIEIQIIWRKIPKRLGSI